MSCNVLFFAEDPGAANYISGLPATLAAKGHGSTVFGERPCRRAVRQTWRCLSDDFDARGREGSDRAPLPKSRRGRHFGPDRHHGPALNRRHSRLCNRIGMSGRRAGGIRAQISRPGRDANRVCSGLARENYLGVGFAAERVIVGGQPHYDRVRAERRQLDIAGKQYGRDKLLPNESRDRPVLMFRTEFSESPGHADHGVRPDDTLNGFSGTTRRTEIVMEEFLAAAKGLCPDLFLNLRLHPKAPKSEFAHYFDTFDMVSQGGSLLPIAYAVGLVVDLSTILLEEAVLLDTPELSIVRRPGEGNWLAGISGRVIPVVLYGDEFCPAMQRLLRRGPTKQQVENALPAGAITHVAALLESRLGEKMECLQ